MKTIIAGSRTITEYQKVLDAIAASGFIITEVVSGTAGGVDSLGEQYAREQQIPLTRWPADWNRFGKRAGYLRNQQMANNAEALIAIWDGESRGTQHMIDIAKAKGLKVFIYRVAPSPIKLAREVRDL